MTPEQTAEFERQLKLRGWCYDVGNEQFVAGDRVLTWEDVVGLVPGLTLDELASYQDERTTDHGKDELGRRSEVLLPH